MVEAMAPTKENAPLSDTETAEKPVREQLKKATLASGLPGDREAMQESGEGASHTSEPARENGERGRLQRKRSFEEVEGDHVEQPASEASARLHTRKRSRDSTAEEAELNNSRKVSGERVRDTAEAAAITAEGDGDKKTAVDDRPGTPEQGGDKRTEAAAEAMASPKTKRSRLHSTTGEGNGALAAEVPPAEDAPTESSTKLPPTSGFANASAVSPFGVLSGSKSPPAELPQTSSSAFASSGFGSLAGSTSSGFGTIGKGSGGFGAGGSFATGGKSTLGAAAGKENEKPKEASAFGGALGQKSAFGGAATTPAAGGFGSSGASGFGKLGAGSGSTFGGALGGSSPFGGAGAGGGLSSFASGKPSSSLAGNSSRGAGGAFGAPAEDDETGGDDDENDESGVKSPPLSQEADHHDERFYEQQIETGEEDEETVYSCRAKLYNFTSSSSASAAGTEPEDGKAKKKEWRERGLGVLRLNVKRGIGEDGEENVQARFLMRADGSHRVVLNTPVKKELKFGAAGGGPPQGGLMLFMGTIEGRSSLEMLQLKIRQNFALELYEKILELQEQM